MLRLVLLAVTCAALPAAAQPMPNIIGPTGPRNLPVTSGLASPGTTTAQRHPGGYTLDATINGTTLPMVFDTGASAVFLRPEDAARAGIDVAQLHYSSLANTANGKAEVAPILLASLTVGGITRRNVQAAITRPGALPVNLLGQSFLRRLRGYRVDNDQLILQGD